MDIDAILEDTGYPVLAEFAMLVSTLTKAMGTLLLWNQPPFWSWQTRKKRKKTVEFSLLGFFKNRQTLFNRACLAVPPTTPTGVSLMDNMFHL
ncbi:MAG TPA: hypothetical protein GX528_08285 [Firmicutes bacterium]|nr:hypothetical protein [Bacillota bacterium]